MPKAASLHRPAKPDTKTDTHAPTPIIELAMRLEDVARRTSHLFDCTSHANQETQDFKDKASLLEGEYEFIHDRIPRLPPRTLADAAVLLMFAYDMAAGVEAGLMTGRTDSDDERIERLVSVIPRVLRVVADAAGLEST
jgi:hypothetical protein